MMFGHTGTQIGLSSATLSNSGHRGAGSSSPLVFKMWRKWLARLQVIRAMPSGSSSMMTVCLCFFTMLWTHRTLMSIPVWKSMGRRLFENVEGFL
ncbi:unnamed protein product [Linum tenue]|uniref:Uncharacterized protein n=1 Tax=Linum tenue TaxID=586396 RepID=A0AAV0RCS7_9ROSI|nr:unnamed protein product [Linum tenue]